MPTMGMEDGSSRVTEARECMLYDEALSQFAGVFHGS